MNLLLINSKADSAFVALVRGDEKIISYASDFFSGETKHQSDTLIRCLFEVKQKSGANSEADAIAVIIGPGAFTGIRVGISIAKGIAVASQKKIIPIDSFELEINRLRMIDESKYYLVLVPAKFPEYYYSLRKEKKEMEQGCIKIDAIESKFQSKPIIVGNFSDESLGNLGYFEVVNTRNLRSEFDSMLKLAKNKFDNGKLFDSNDIDALYIKDFIPKRPKQI